MSAINMNLDEKFRFNFERKVIIGGQTYNVTFNDEMDRVLRDLQVEMGGLYEQTNNQSDEFEEMTIDERKKYLNDRFKQIILDVEKALDGILGKVGAGKSIYDYYNQQSYALYETLRVLRETKEKLDGTAKEQERQKHQARIDQYTGRKKRVKKHADANSKRSK